MTVRALLDKADGVPGKLILWINLALCAFVGVAHGGALAITYVKPTPDAQGIRQLAAISLPLVAVVSITAAVALLWPQLRRPTLKLHGAVLALGAVAAWFWALSLVIGGIPEGNFAWSPGLMSLLVAYGIYVFSRYSVPDGVRGHAAFFYAPLAALVVAVPIDLVVFVRLINEMSARFG